MLFRMLYDDKLAQAAYFIGCQATGEAIVIDPERDVDRYLEVAEKEGMKIVAITETHIHADFLSGARELAERTGAKLYLSDEGDADWKYQWLDKKQGGGSYNHQLVKDGDVFMVGNIEFKVIHTPGHTPEHISFLVTDKGGGANEPMGIATGDFVFVGDVGRPDLLETAAGVKGAKEQSAKVMYKSLQLFKQLPDYLQVWPGHGSGSACGKALGAVPQSTVGYEKRFNAAINAASNEQRFVQSILHGQPEPPLYFARMKRDNKMGPPLLGKMPEPKRTAIEEIRKAMENGAALLDTREWGTYIEGHLPGALFAPLNNAFPTVAGSYVEEKTPIYLIVPEERVKEAVTDLIRIGLDDVVGFATPEDLQAYAQQGGKLNRIVSKSILELKNGSAPKDALVLDVRRADEFEEGHLPGAINVAHTRLLERLNEIPKDKTILVHCRTDNRSAFAAGLLDAKGYPVVHLSGGFVEWSANGAPVVK
jgi:hydroxyacylglutathione hydrolase